MDKWTATVKGTTVTFSGALTTEGRERHTRADAAAVDRQRGFARRRKSRWEQLKVAGVAESIFKRSTRR